MLKASWRVLIVLLTQLSLLGCSNLVTSTDASTEFARRGFYAGGGLSVVDERFRAFEHVGHDADELRPGLNLIAGYRFHPRGAVELAAHTYAAFEVEIVGGPDGEVEGQALTAALKGYFSTSHFQPYGLLGAGRAETANSAGVGAEGQDLVLVLGAGADYYFGPDLALVVEAAYFQPRGDTDGFAFQPLTVGLVYRF